MATWTLLSLALLLTVYSKAFNVIISTSIAGLILSYILPVILWARKRWKGERLELGPWNLGRFGGWVNAAAIAWSVFAVVLFVSPPNQVAGYTFAGLLIFLVAYYLAAARSVFKGPKKLGTEEDLLRMEKTIEKQAVYKEA